MSCLIHYIFTGTNTNISVTYWTERCLLCIIFKCTAENPGLLSEELVIANEGVLLNFYKCSADGHRWLKGEIDISKRK